MSLPVDVWRWARAGLDALKRWEEATQGSEEETQAAMEYCHCQEQVVASMHAADKVNRQQHHHV